MTTDEWKVNIKLYLDRIADRDYQQLAWFNRHREQTDPGELICLLIDDWSFEKFLGLSEAGFSADQQAAGRSFVAQVKEFVRKRPGPLDPFETIDDPLWDGIRKSAKGLMTTLAL